MAPVFTPLGSRDFDFVGAGSVGQPCLCSGKSNFNVYGGVDYAIVYINTANGITPEQIAARYVQQDVQQVCFPRREQFTQGYVIMQSYSRLRMRTATSLRPAPYIGENKAPEAAWCAFASDLRHREVRRSASKPGVPPVVEQRAHSALTAYYAKVKEGKWSSLHDFADVNKRFDMKISLYSCYYITDEIMSELVGYDLTHKTYTMMLVMERSEGDPLRGFVQFIYTDPKNPVVEWPAALTFGAFGDEYGGQIDLKEKDLLSDAAAYGVTEYYAEVKEGSFATVEEFDASPNPILGEPHQFKINPNTYNTSDEVLYNCRRFRVYE